MPRSPFTPLAVALSALLLAPVVSADPSSPLFVVEQQRSALVSRLAKQWSVAFAAFPKERRLDHEQLSNALFALRADRLFAVTLAGDAEAVEALLEDAKREAVKPRAAAKALGDATADLTYTPINPCRILDTRATVAGPLSPNVARIFDGYSANFATQGGTASGCGIPNGAAALAMNVYAVNPTNLGFIKVWPASGTEPDVSTVNYQPGITAIATGTLVPVDQANSNRFTAKSPASVDFIADVVGYFKPPESLNVVWVAKSGAPFTSIQEAIDFAATKASSTSPYLIKVAPGTYSERVVVPDYVTIEGSGRDNTLITSIQGAGTVFVNAISGAELRLLSIENKSGQTTTVALYVTVGAKVRLVDVSLGTNGMFGDSATVSANQGTVELVSSRVKANGPGNCQGILAYQLALRNSKVFVSCNGSHNSGVLLLGGISTISGSEIVVSGSSQSSVGVLASAGILAGSSSAKVQVDTSLLSAATGALGSTISAMADAAAELRIRGSVLDASGGLVNHSVVRSSNAQAGVAQCELRAPTTGAPLCIGNYTANLIPVTCP